MIKLDVGNVLLKPSHRRQLMAWLKRAGRLSRRLGDLAISITMQRTGRTVEIKADVGDRTGGAVGFRAREHDWRDAARELVRMVTAHLHEQMLHRTPA
jgi:hypothetical protein